MIHSPHYFPFAKKILGPHQGQSALSSLDLEVTMVSRALLLALTGNEKERNIFWGVEPLRFEDCLFPWHNPEYSYGYIIKDLPDIRKPQTLSDLLE